MVKRQFGPLGRTSLPPRDGPWDGGILAPRAGLKETSSLLAKHGVFFNRMTND
jgi:hypothetical protein